MGAPGRRTLGANVPYVSCSSFVRLLIVRNPVSPFQRARAPALSVTYGLSVRSTFSSSPRNRCEPTYAPESQSVSHGVR